MSSIPRDYHVILYYKYTPLSSNKDVMTKYQEATKELCTSLNLTGRVLLGMSDNAEGINGTLAGSKVDIVCYTHAMLGRKYCQEKNILKTYQHKSTANASNNGMTTTNNNDHRLTIMEKFFDACEQFAKDANVDIPYLDSPEDFKWSSAEDSNEDLFPDLQIKLVKEIVSTGGVLSSISIKETSKNYLTPQEWHDEMKRLDDADNETILIDCRNHKEFAVGHFQHAIDPNTKIFAQFPRWVQENKSALKDKKVLMYCTGGIRCEKASAYIRNELEDVSSTGSVFHLKGGIHKYLDQYAADGYFHGKNFVFDRRLCVDAEEHKKNGSFAQENDSKMANEIIVGQCQYCKKQYDNFTGDKICTVCRDLVLICEECQSNVREYHCDDHMHLRNCYFTNLHQFNEKELEAQLNELESHLFKIAIGRRYKQKRQTLHKQCDKVRARLLNIKESDKEGLDSSQLVNTSCRSCGSESCDGQCWGIHGLKRKNELAKVVKAKTTKAPRLSANNRPSKVAQKRKEIQDIKKLKLSEPPNAHRDEATSIRCPPPCIRVLSTSVKGKWCGRTIKSVLESEFHDFSDRNVLEETFKRSLIHIDGIPVNCDEALRRGVDANKALSPDTVLKNMDTISRIQYWQEPPVLVPDQIDVDYVEIPKIVCDELMPNLANDEDRQLLCCNKPSSVPVHPAGPYYQNSLLLMIEAQERLEPRSLLNCHRLDRCTSGLTLCCTNPKVARLIQVQVDIKAVSKAYLARVKGKFPTAKSMIKDEFPIKSTKELQCTWCEKNDCLEVDAPIELVDVIRGQRGIKESGKSAKSRFKFLSYDDQNNTSTIMCFPITGRQHQLRVHLCAIGFPIHNDILYGGEIDTSQQDKRKIQSIEAIQHASQRDKCHLSISDFIKEESITQAKEVSLCCKGKIGIEQSFNSAQLLVEGHAIDLHALAYRIKFHRKGKKNTKSQKNEMESNIIAELDLGVGAPSWAAGIDITAKSFSWLDK